MTTRFKVPSAVAEAPRSGSKRIPPEGIWKAPITEVRVRELHRGDPGDFLIESDTGKTASLQLGGPLTPLADGQDDPGQMPMFDEYVLQDGDFRWDDAELPKGAPGRLYFTRKGLTNLALALGLTESDGNGAVGPIEDFHDMLISGEIKGQKVAFQIVHETFKRRNGEDGIKAIVEAYSSVV